MDRGPRVAQIGLTTHAQGNKKSKAWKLVQNDEADKSEERPK